MLDFYNNLDNFMNYCQIKGLSKKTQKSYEQTLNLFFIYLEREKNITSIKKIKSEHLEDYIKYLFDRGKYSVVADNNSFILNNPQQRKDYNKAISKTTINNYIRNIKVFMNYMVEKGEIEQNIVKPLKQVKNSRIPKEYIDDRTFKRLLNALDISKTPEFRDFIIIQLLFDTGMRVGECLAIEIDDLDLKHKTILLKAENTKGKKVRNVYFSNQMSKYLKRWLQTKDRYYETELLFPSINNRFLEVGNFEKNLSKYSERIGVKITPHQIRNNFSKRYLMAGGSIYQLSLILGHSSVTTTEKAYLDLTDEDIRTSYIKFSPLENLRK